jgi:hypothetical protein
MRTSSPSRSSRAIHSRRSRGGAIVVQSRRPPGARRRCLPRPSVNRNVTVPVGRLATPGSCDGLVRRSTGGGVSTSEPSARSRSR